MFKKHHEALHTANRQKNDREVRILLDNINHALKHGDFTLAPFKNRANRIQRLVNKAKHYAKRRNNEYIYDTVNLAPTLGKIIAELIELDKEIAQHFQDDHQTLSAMRERIGKFAA